MKHELTPETIEMIVNSWEFQRDIRFMPRYSRRPINTTDPTPHPQEGFFVDNSKTSSIFDERPTILEKK